MSEVFEHRELLQPEPAEALADLLDVPAPGPGTGLPLCWHWVYLLERSPQRDLGDDGHPIRNAVLVPPGPGRRRMWAGGEVESAGDLRIGEEAVRRSRVVSTDEKQGRSGRLTITAVEHLVLQRGSVVVRERQDIVYRDAAPAGAEAPGPVPVDRVAPAPIALAPGERELEVTESLLFRFSALTYNAHRIHYDRDFCRDVDGYPDLVTHGPLQALAMAEAARAAGAVTRPGRRFSYRLVSPLFAFQGLVAGTTEHAADRATYIRDLAGRRTAHGVVTGG